MNEMKILVNKIAARAATTNRIVDGDYQAEDGLWHCGKCHGAKQTVQELFGEIITPFCLCDCEKAKRDAEEAERKRLEFEKKVDKLRHNCFAEKNMFEWNFENDDMSNPRLTKAMQNYVENFPELRKRGKGLLLHGVYGTGKTFAACEVANALLNKGFPVLVTNFAQILNILQGTFEKQEYLNSLTKYSLLVIDDLGIERDTEFAKEQVYNVIDARYRSGKPMIITTNLSMDNMKKPTDRENLRIYDRIFECCFPIECNGVSRRRQTASRDYEDMKNLLGL